MKHFSSIALRLPIILGALSLLSITAAIAAPTQRAVKITEATRDATGLVIRGTITNHFSPGQSAGCNSSLFQLIGMGKVYQGVAQCDAPEIAPKAKIGFSVVFPAVPLGTYHLRFQRLHDPDFRAEIVPVPIGLKAPTPTSTLSR